MTSLMHSFVKTFSLDFVILTLSMLRIRKMAALKIVECKIEIYLEFVPAATAVIILELIKQ